MMKKFKLLLLLLMTCSAMASAHDCNSIGFKGEVNSVDFYSYIYNVANESVDREELKKYYKELDRERGTHYKTQYTTSGDLQQLYLDSPLNYIVFLNSATL